MRKLLSPILCIAVMLIIGCGIILPGCKQKVDQAKLGQLKDLASASLGIAQDFSQVLPALKAKDAANDAAVNRYLVSHQAGLAKAARAWSNAYKAAQTSAGISPALLVELRNEVASAETCLQAWTAETPFLNVDPTFAQEHLQALKEYAAQVKALADAFASPPAPAPAAKTQ